MAGSVRVNLSVPAEVYEVLVGVAGLTGQSVAGVVMGHVGYALPEMKRFIRRQDAHDAALGGRGVSGGASVGKNALKARSVAFEGMSRRERREAERDLKKGRR